ncbi:hypothetical protein CL620_06270 [archaeon]|nr:hypothetical protein [archaeon]|tara:strand:+ start:1053 stop:1349 length:297 start_codon:yes stop_codon:yes gene_type:complete
MPPKKKYYIVEYRYAIRVDGISDVESAMSRSNSIAERKFGFRPENWFARIFEYAGGVDDIGPTAEFFYNPHSHSYREVTRNWESHMDMIKKGESPNDK